ncbi:MAG TPA: acyl-CoA dehydrogenase family protein [Terrimesophilobacter sp.]|nr:acyl-CoA dehydrogenase family protein [Terrimesophilobacter sp.]HRP98845.1 acyl-CoA dehydrogenase family protein [Terrimesophilobacter sp.]
MTWPETHLEVEERQLRDLVGAVCADIRSEDPATLSTARSALVNAGIWSLDLIEGDGLLPLVLATLTMAETSPALAWSFVQAIASTVLFESAGGAEYILEGGTAVVVSGDVPGSGDSFIARIIPSQTGCAVAILPREGFGPGTVVYPNDIKIVSRGPITGLDGLESVTLTITAAHTVGNEEVASRARRVAHVGTIAIAAGLSLAAAGLAENWVREREQFGAPLIAIGSVAGRVADLRGRANGLLRSARALATDAEAPLDHQVIADCEQAIGTAEAAVQLHGGYGYMRENTVEHLLRDAVSLRAAAWAICAPKLVGA